jgi:exonuclease SbcC
MANLQYIKVKGSYGIHYGLGVDEIAVNFEHLSGLINLAGNNGQGKTTFMEMLSPFPLFPSRQQKNPQKYNFKKQFRLRDSYKEVCYLHQGKKYVFRVEIPAGTTMSPEGYITCDGAPMVKGKISEYKRVVSELFGSEKLFYSSIFSCQGGQKLTDLTVGDFKNLLIELLGLKKYNEYWHNAGACIKECESALSEVLRDLEYYSTREEEILRNSTSLKENLASVDVKKTEISGFERKAAAIREELSRLAQESAEAQKQEAVLAEKNKQLAAITDQIISLRAEKAEVVRLHNEWIEKMAEETAPLHELVDQKEMILTASQSIKELKLHDSLLRNELNDVTVKGNGLKEKISGIDLAIANIKTDRLNIENDPELKSLEEQIKALNDEKANTERKIAELNTRIAAISDDPAIKAMQKELEQFKAAESLLALRPGACLIDACPFIKNALEKISMKPAKEKEIADAIAKNQGLITETKPALVAWESSIVNTEMNLASLLIKREDKKELAEENLKKLSEEEAELLSEKAGLEKGKAALSEAYLAVNTKLKDVPGKIADLEALANKKPELELAEQKLGLLEKSILEKNQAFALGDSDIQRKIEKLELDAAPLSAEILMITPARTQADIQIDIDLSNQSMAHTDIGLKNAVREASDIEKTIAVLEDKAKAAAKDIEEIARLKSRESFIREELSKWSYIRDAVSKSGLQALEISAAAPLLTGIANDLLHAAYGGEFYLDLITQDPETGAEILDIMITREDGKTYSLCDFSGGESVWILQAFKAAQILVNTEKSGIHFATCFADEESGALDKEKAERFIQMYRALMVQGNFEKLFFISHIPECQAMADHSLVFQKGGIVSESDIGMVA